MTEARALFFADWRAFVNDAKRAVRSPMRLFIWLCYALWFAFFIVNRVATQGHRTGSAGPDIGRADFLICSLLLALVLTFAFGAGRLGFFRTRAEALFITGSSVPAPIAIAYLQTRESLGLSLRSIWSVVLFGFVVGPRQFSPLAAGADVLLFFALVAAQNAIALPRRFAPPAIHRCCIIAGSVLAILLIEAPLRDFAGSPPIPAGIAHLVRQVLPAWHPGYVMFAPNPLWLAGALAIMATGIAIVARYGRDAYPDLYALSLARIDAVAFRAELQGAIREKQRALPTVPVRIPAPAGPLVLLWKSVVEFRRQHRDLRFLIGGVVIWVLVGAGFAVQVAGSGRATAATLAVGCFVMFMLSVAETTSVTADLRRPLFWLSGSPLFERVCALVTARNWRKTFSFALIALGIAIAGGPAIDVLVIAVLLPALVIFFTSVGVAIYSLAPENAGAPALALRLVTTVVLLVAIAPIALLGALAGAFLDTAIVALALLAESAGLVAFATWRIGGRIDRLVA